MSSLKVFSGKCCLSDIGIEVGHLDYDGNPIHTGDIVMVWHGHYIGTDSECWYPAGNLTAVVSDQYQSFSNGSVVEKEGAPEPFVMGIKDCGFNSTDWHIHIVKKFNDVVEGEKWPAYGFSYQSTDVI